MRKLILSALFFIVTTTAIPSYAEAAGNYESLSGVESGNFFRAIANMPIENDINSYNQARDC